MLGANANGTVVTELHKRNLEVVKAISKGSFLRNGYCSLTKPKRFIALLS